jgi:hypothetical protein
VSRSMAVSRGVGKVVAVVVAAGFLGAGVWAWRASAKRGRGFEAEREARFQLVRAAGAMVRCSAEKRALPETSPRVPARLADLATGPYQSKPEDWQDAAFRCMPFSIKSPQLLQYRWLKRSDVSGALEARIDTDADGVADKWFEVEITCSPPGTCYAANFPSEVLEDGTREPPILLRVIGRANRYVGEPPSLRDDEPTEASAPPPPAPKPLAPINAGAPASLDAVYLDAERRAGALLSGAALLELEFKGVKDKLADAAQGTTVRGLYGIPDAKGNVPRGAEVVSVTFDKAGMTEAKAKAGRDLHVVGFAECLPEKLLQAIGPVTARSMTLSWDVKRERALWRVQQPKAAPRTFSVDHCSQVK